MQARRQEFRALTLQTRTALSALYTSALPDADKRRRKAELFAALRADYARLKSERWGGFAGYDGWIARANNASLACRRAYNELVPDFERLFERKGGDFDALLCRGQAPGRLAQGRAPRHTARTVAARSPAMPDIRIHREHTLGLPKARKVAWQWAEDVEKKFDMECTVLEGETSDTVEFTRAGVNGQLIVATDHFDLDAKLGFLLGAFAKTIEGEIEKNLDALLGKAAAAPKKRRRKK